MVSKIVMAVDHRSRAEEMEKFLHQFALPPGAELKVVHAIEPIEAIAAWPSEQYTKEAEQLVDWVTKRLSAAFPQLKVQGAVLEGFATEQIVDVAQAWGADLIVVGSHGKRGMTRFLMGSVSSAVVSHAPCSVLVLRNVHKGKYSATTKGAATQVHTGKS